MGTLKHFKIILFLICVSTFPIETRKKYPKIQDVVSFSRDSLYMPRVVKQIRSTLDVSAYRKNTELFRELVRGNLDTMEFGEQLNRRTYLEHYDKKTAPEETRDAMNYQFRTKIVDCMLQLVYMARHFLKAFERHEYLDKETLTFRIGYISKKLKMLFMKAMKILEILNIKQKNHAWRNVKSEMAPLTLHHKVAKINVDFEYYYMLLKKIHGLNTPYEPPSVHLKVYQLPTLMDQYTASN